MEQYSEEQVKKINAPDQAKQIAYLFKKKQVSNLTI